MIYERIHPARFLARPNRFIAQIELDGKEQLCHVKNTGRCRELLIPGAEIFVQETNNPNRKTKFDLISVYKGNKLINIDSQAPNRLFAEWVQKGGLFENVTLMKPEVTYGSSRFDFYLETREKQIFVEVKGVTLEENGVARFPDAPTLRGVKHLQELAACTRQGYEAYAVFVIQMKNAVHFSPNDETHPAFGQALRQANEAGVHILAVDCDVTEDSIFITQPVKIVL